MEFAEYEHTINGDVMKIEIRDFTRRIVYRNKINLNDKKSVQGLLVMLEKYCPFSVYDLIKTWQPI